MNVDSCEACKQRKVKCGKLSYSTVLEKSYSTHSSTTFIPYDQDYRLPLLRLGLVPSQFKLSSEFDQA